MKTQKQRFLFSTKIDRASDDPHLAPAFCMTNSQLSEIFFMPTYCSTSKVALCFRATITDGIPLRRVTIGGSVPELGDWSDNYCLELKPSLENFEVWHCEVQVAFFTPYFEYRYTLWTNDNHSYRDIIRRFQTPASKLDLIDSQLQPNGKILVEISDKFGDTGTKVRIFAPEHYTEIPKPQNHCLNVDKLLHLRSSLMEIKLANQRLREDVVGMASKILIKPPMPKTRPSKSDELIKRLLLEINELKGKVKVVCRFRPMSSIINSKQRMNYSMDPHEGLVTICSDGDVYNPVRSFQLDDVFAEETTNLDFFLSGKLKSLVESCVIVQNNVCVFAYGQTGSGKTHTMIGNHEEEGVIKLGIRTIFETIANSNLNRIIEAEVLEVYRENLFKLVQSTRVNDCDELMDTFTNALESRATASTNMNDQSSRSHCVFILSLTDPATKVVSKIFLVDLAGSERTKFSGAEGDRLAEANSINKSLSTLGLVLNGLLNKRKFIPYRDSKLTQILAPVFTRTSPPSKIVMIANVSPSSSDFRETVSTLNFAQRVGEIEMRNGMRGEDKENLETKTEQLNELLAKPKSRLSRSRSFCV